MGPRGSIFACFTTDPLNYPRTRRPRGSSPPCVPPRKRYNISKRHSRIENALQVIEQQPPDLLRFILASKDHLTKRDIERF